MPYDPSFTGIFWVHIFCKFGGWGLSNCFQCHGLSETALTSDRVFKTIHIKDAHSRYMGPASRALLLDQQSLTLKFAISSDRFSANLGVHNIIYLGRLGGGGVPPLTLFFCLFSQSVLCCNLC